MESWNSLQVYSASFVWWQCGIWYRLPFNVLYMKLLFHLFSLFLLLRSLWKQAAKTKGRDHWNTPWVSYKVLGTQYVPVSSLGLSVILTGVRVGRSTNTIWSGIRGRTWYLFSHEHDVMGKGSIMHAVCQTIGSLLGVYTICSLLARYMK